MKHNHDGELKQTMYVVRNGVEFRIDADTYDGKETISGASHFVPPGAEGKVEVAPSSEDVAPAPASKSAKSGKTVEPVNTAPAIVPGTVKAWQGTAGLIYTAADASGKFWRVDDKGAALIDKPFDTENDAAAATI